jgi:enoyl-CoA hydratase/carnithine racemase
MVHELIDAMDTRLAAGTATFGFAFARRGMVPEGASGWFLPASSASVAPSSGA